MRYREGKEFLDEFKRGAVLPRSFPQLFRGLAADREFVYQSVNTGYRQFVGKDLSRDRLDELLLAFPGWTMYMAGWAHAMYNRAIKESGFGVKGKADPLDLHCSIYLPHCHVFVTDDRGQFAALRVLSRISPNKPRALLYSTFRTRLLNAILSRAISRHLRLTVAKH